MKKMKRLNAALTLYTVMLLTSASASPVLAQSQGTPSPDGSRASGEQSVRGLYVQGVEHHRAGRYREAIAAFEQVVGLAAGDAVALNNLGAAYLDAGRYPEALRPLRQAVGLRPGMAEAHRNLGIPLNCSPTRMPFACISSAPRSH